jgi:hypothetical protein
MKLAYIVYLAPLFAATACLASGDDRAATSEQDQLSQGGGGGGGGAPPAATNLVSVSVTPNPLPGGHPATGILALSGLQGNGGGSTLTSSDPAVLTVPSEFFALATQSVGWFNVVAAPVAAPTSVVVTATQLGTGIARSVVVNVVPATAPPVADVVQVQTARFQFVGGRGGNIEVQATSTNPNAILSVIFLPGNFEGFVLTNNGGGRYSAARPTTSSSVPPQIFVRSNFGGASPTFSLQ